MALDDWLRYAGTVLVLMSTPGPSQLLMLSNSMANGAKRSLATAAGDLTANVLQMLAAGLGLGALVVASEHAFVLIKWLGVAYLLWIGVGRLRKAGQGALTEATAKPLKSLWIQGFVTSAANPKAVVFFAALFPLFIEPGGGMGLQLLILMATYLLLDGLFLITYARGAAWIAERLNAPAKRWLDYGAGGFLIAAGVLLGLKSASR